MAKCKYERVEKLFPIVSLEKGIETCDGDDEMYIMMILSKEQRAGRWWLSS